MAKINKTLISGSLILLIAFNVYNVLNFVFQFSMARLLTIAEYGTLASLFAIIYLLTIFSESIQTIIAKYSSQEKKLSKLKNIFKKSLSKAFIISLFVFILYLIISWPLSYFLKIDYFLLSLNGLMIFTSLLVPIGRGLMLGKKRFKSLGGNMLIESTIKLVLAISLVLLGWKVYGAIVAAVIGGLCAFAYSFKSLRFILSEKEEKAETTGIYNYSLPVFAIMVVIILFYSIDVIIAKIVFSDEIAGYYALASILGKSIFWGTQPISRAMFPLSAEKKAKKEGNLFFNALGLVSLLIIIALSLFYFFPDLILGIFSGKENLAQASEVLLLVGIAFSLQALTNLLLLYKLSQGSIKGYMKFSIFIVIEAIILFYFSSSLVEFSMAYVVASFIFLVGSFFLLRKK